MLLTANEFFNIILILEQDNHDHSLLGDESTNSKRRKWVLDPVKILPKQSPFNADWYKLELY